MANGIGARVRRMLPFARRGAPRTPPGGEVAASNIGERLAPFIGELPLDPRQPSRYAHSVRDDAHAIRVYRDTLRDDRCAAALDQRLNAAISKPWEVEPGGADARDKEAAEDLAMQLKAVDFDATCRQLLHGVWYGYAVGEALWGRDDRRVVIDDLIVRAADRFRWDAAAEPLLRTETNIWGQPIPPGKFVVLCRPGEHGDLPHGPGLARWCFWPVWLKRHGLKFWSVALEKFGAPGVVGTYPRNATKPEKDALLELVHAYATSLGVTIPEGQKIEIVESARRSGGDFRTFCEYLDRSITTTILGQSSTTDQGPWRGTAEVQQDVRDETVAADVRLLDSALNGSIARWLTEWNFPGAAIPRIRRDVEPADDLDARAEREERIANTSGLRPTKAHVETVYGGEWEAPPKPEQQAGAPPTSEEAAMAALTAFASGRPDDAIGRAAAQLVRDEWEPMMAPVIEPILAAAAGALARGDSLEAFRDSLPEFFAAMDDSRIVETLHRMGFTATLSGEAGLDSVPSDA